MKRVVVFVMLLYPTILLAGNNGSPERFSRSFLTLLDEGKVSEAFERLREFASRAEQSDLARVESSVATGVATLGSSRGFELVEKDRYGDAIMRLVYVVKYDSEPMIWEFYFYSPDGSWRLKAMNYSSDITTIRICH